MDSPQRPIISRKASGLDYDEELALPMPKPRHYRVDQDDVGYPSFDENNKPHVLKKRSITEPAMFHDAMAPESSPPRGLHDGRKKSRLDMIKSKLSFKDLRKEALKDEASSHSETPSAEDLKARPRRVVTGSSIPSFSPSTYGFKSKPKPKEPSKSSTPTSATTGAAGQVGLASTRIPLPPSGTFSNIQGTMAIPRSPSNGQFNNMIPQAPPSADPTSIKNQSEPAVGRVEPILTGTPQPDIVITRPSFEASRKKHKNRNPSTPGLSASKYPVTTDSPPTIGDLCEGEGKVKYLPKDWLEGSPSPPQGIKARVIAPTAYGRNETPVNSLPDHLPSFRERLQNANIPLSNPTSPETRPPSTTTQMDDLIDMVRSIQRQTDSGISGLNKKFEDLSSWVGDQLRSQIEGISDLGRANSDLLGKQCQMSREMMKFQLDIRLEMGVMGKRLTDFESKLFDQVQGEVKALMRSYEELNHRTEAMISKHASYDTQNFIEQQHRKNAEIESEIAYLKTRQALSINQLQAQSLPSQPRPSESSIGSADPSIRQAPALPLAPRPPISPVRSRLVSLPENKPTAMLPRSVSFTKRGFLKGIKDMTSTSPDSKERTMDKPRSSEESKKWTVFGFRRRRDQTDNPSGGNKFPWSSPHRAKDNPVVEETSSSHSSSPTLPSVVRNIPHPMDNPSSDGSNVHPAFRATAQQGVWTGNESVTTSTATSTQLSGATQAHSTSEIPLLTDSHTALTHDDLLDSMDRVAPSTEASQTTSFHTGFQEHSPAPSANGDTQRSLLLGESEWVLHERE